MSSASILQKPKTARAPKDADRGPIASFNEQFVAELIRNVHGTTKVVRNKATQLEACATSKSRSTPSFERLTEGTLELARTVHNYTVDDDRTKPRAGKAHDFRAAYSAILQSVPVDRRRTLLLRLREGLDAIAKTELEAADTAKNTEWSTAAFMADLALQEADQRVRDVAEGRLVPAAAMAALLKMTPQAVGGALKAKRIFTLRGPTGAQVYPAFFADESLDRKVLEKVSKALGDLPGAAKWDFFMTPRLSLGKRTPLEALAKGKVDAVITAANAFMDE